MATVNLTPTLRNDILMKIAEPFKTQYLDAATTTKEDGKFLYERFMVTPEQTAMMRALPEAWVGISNYKNLDQFLYLAYKDPNRGKNDPGVHFLRLSLPKTDTYVYYNWTNNCSENPLNIEQQRNGWLAEDFSDPALGLSKDYLSKLVEIVKERNSVIDTAKRMLEGCATVNQVDKIWPAIRKYIKPETVQRLDRKNGQTTASSIGIADADLAALSVTHIRNQMTS